MNHVTFCFWADRAVLGSKENSEILLKYPNFVGAFLCFIGQKIKNPII